MVVRWMAGLVIAGALVAGVLLYYRTEVCDQQLTEAGKVVTVCRNLRAADPPVVAIGLIAFVALTAFFSEISGFGISLKRELRNATRTAKEAKNTAHSALQSSQVAEEVTLDVGRARADQGVADVPASKAKIDDLISQYNRIRVEDKESSPERTARMTAVVARMVSTLSGVGKDVLDPETYLDARDDGHRMAAFSYVYANPDPRLAQTLVAAVIAEPTRFGQYWGIRALRRLNSLDSSALDFNSLRDLERLLSRLGPNTDRSYELRQLLAEAQKK
jgi:hypothetical protein